MKSKRAPKKKPKKPIDPLVAQLGARIRQLRKQEGFTSYEDFANDRELPASQYGRYEKGQNLRYTSLVKIAGVFGMTLQEFFSEGFD
jgi:transcriptional regulator with XRE-family HTH domain